MHKIFIFMKKIISTVVLFFRLMTVTYSYGQYGQIIPIGYTNLANSNGASNSYNYENDNSIVSDAYYVSNGKFKRIKIKLVESYNSVKVVKYLSKNSYHSEWINCSTSQVQPVNEYSDGEAVASNFYYKTYIFELGRWIYF